MMHEKNKTIYVLAAAVIFIFVLGGIHFQKKTVIEFPGSNISITAEVADSPFLREKGLMFRQELPQNSGMLFIFETPQELKFWMKNTLIPLDMIFISENFTIVNIVENAKPCTNNCEIYSSILPAKYTVETNAGFVEKNGIKIGDSVRIG